MSLFAATWFDVCCVCEDQLAIHTPDLCLTICPFPLDTGKARVTLPDTDDEGDAAAAAAAAAVSGLLQRTKSTRRNV